MLLPVYRYKNKFLTPYIYAGPRIEQKLNYNDGGLVSFYRFLNNTNTGFITGFEKEISKSINITADFRYSRDFTSFKSVFTLGGTFANYTNSSFDFPVRCKF